MGAIIRVVANARLIHLSVASAQAPDILDEIGQP